VTPEDLHAVVDVGAALPPSDIDKLVVAIEEGPQFLRALRAESAGQLREACSTIIGTAERAPLAEISGALQGAAAVSRSVSDRVDLVWTGPDVPGSVSRLTSSAVADLVDEARAEILLMSFTTHSEPTLTAALARALDRGVYVQVLYERHDDNPSFNSLTFPFPGLNIRRLCWPIDQRPPGASMHAKALVIDREISLIGSANITGTAMLRNIECGVLVRDRTISTEIVESIESLLSRKIVRKCDR
jgi:cardiolipin synthase A/B